MKPPSLRRRVMVMLLLASACGADEASVCDQLGRLCDDRDISLRLDLARSANASADLDGDGRRDMVTATPGGGLSIAWAGTRRREYRLGSGGAPDVELADVDGDADLDVLYVTAEPAALRVLTNDGTRALPETREIALRGRPQSLWVGRLDDDDTPDAVVATAVPGGLIVLTHDLEDVREIIAGQTLVAVEAGDVDGDGDLDLVAADLSDSALVVVHAPEFATPVRIATGAAPEHLQLVDLDGDRSLDALTHGQAGPEVWFHAGDGAGGFLGPRALTVQGEASEGFVAHRAADGRRWLLTIAGRSLVASELDDDDRVVRRVVAGSYPDASRVERDGDAVLTSDVAGSARWGLAPAHVFTELWRTDAGSYHPVVLADFDSDGLLDLAVAEEDAVEIRMGRADGSWTEPSAIAGSDGVLWMTRGEVTGDGLPDLVLGKSFDLQIAVGRGDGRFTPGTAAPLPVSAWALHSGFDPFGVGADAVVVASDTHDEPGIFVLRFDAAGALTSELRALSIGNALRFASADIDGDGRDDLVALVLEGGEAWLVTLSGVDAGPARWRSLSAVLADREWHDTALALGDLDNDGTVDAAVISQDAIVRFHDLASEDPPPPETERLDNFYGAQRAAVAEVDGDGRPDLVYCASGELGVVLGAADDSSRLQAPYDQFNRACDLHVDPTSRRASAATASERGVSVLAPSLAPALSRPDPLGGGGPGPLVELDVGDVDADGHDDLVVRDAVSAELSGLTVLWGHESGQPQRATWLASWGDRSAVVVAPLDEVPGDEVVVADDGFVEVTSLRDDVLDFGENSHFDIDEVLAVAVQARRVGPADVIVFGRTDEQLRLVALPRDASGAFTQEVELWAGAEGMTPPALAVADFDADGDADMAVSPGAEELLRIVWGDGERTGESLEIDVGSVDGIAGADADGDGVAELIVSRSEALSFDLRGRLARPPTALKFGYAFGERFFAADIEGDGHADLVGGNLYNIGIALRSATGSRRVVLHSDFGEWRSVHAVALDGDAILDFVGLRDGHVVLRRSGPEGR